jgi:hypothetical protein
LLVARLPLSAEEAAAITGLVLDSVDPGSSGPRLPPADMVAITASGTLRWLGPRELDDSARAREAALILRALLPDSGSESDSPAAAALRTIAADVLRNGRRGTDLGRLRDRLRPFRSGRATTLILADLWRRWRDWQDDEPASRREEETLASRRDDATAAPSSSAASSATWQPQIVDITDDEALPWDFSDHAPPAPDVSAIGRQIRAPQGRRRQVESRRGTASSLDAPGARGE